MHWQNRSRTIRNAVRIREREVIGIFACNGETGELNWLTCVIKTGSSVGGSEIMGLAKFKENYRHESEAVWEEVMMWGN